MKVFIYCPTSEERPLLPPAVAPYVEWSTTVPQDPYTLMCKDQKLVLQKNEGPENPMDLDYAYLWEDWKRQKISPKTDLLAKACAVRAGTKILDLTMGLANDSLKLVYFGADVTAVEQELLVWVWVTSELERWPKDISLKTVFNDGCVYAQEHVAQFDVFYLDPMFHLEKRTALPKKKMQFLSELLNENTDDQFLPTVEFLRNHKKRIVIKRHPDAPPFAGLKPKAIYKGKKIRFEVF